MIFPTKERSIFRASRGSFWNEPKLVWLVPMLSTDICTPLFLTALRVRVIRSCSLSRIFALISSSRDYSFWERVEYSDRPPALKGVLAEIHSIEMSVPLRLGRQQSARLWQVTSRGSFLLFVVTEVTNKSLRVLSPVEPSRKNLQKSGGPVMRSEGMPKPEEGDSDLPRPGHL